jgi:hypothetical protein
MNERMVATGSKARVDVDTSRSRDRRRTEAAAECSAVSAGTDLVALSSRRDQWLGDALATAMGAFLRGEATS